MAYDPEFVRVDIPEHVLQSDIWRFIADLLSKQTFLERWELGRKGSHISSQFILCDGTCDRLTSVTHTDDDYIELLKAHTQRMAELTREWGLPRQPQRFSSAVKTPKKGKGKKGRGKR